MANYRERERKSEGTQRESAGSRIRLHGRVVVRKPDLFTRFSRNTCNVIDTRIGRDVKLSAHASNRDFTVVCTVHVEPNATDKFGRFRIGKSMSIYCRT